MKTLLSILTESPTRVNEQAVVNDNIPPAKVTWQTVSNGPDEPPSFIFTVTNPLMDYYEPGEKQPTGCFALKTITIDSVDVEKYRGGWTLELQRQLVVTPPQLEVVWKENSLGNISDQQLLDYIGTDKVAIAAWIVDNLENFDHQAMAQFHDQFGPGEPDTSYDDYN